MGYEQKSMVARKTFQIIDYDDNFTSVFMFFFLIQTPQNSWLLKNVRVIIPLYSLLKLFNKIKKMFADTSTSQAIVCQCSDLKVSKKVLVGIILCG